MTVKDLIFMLKKFPQDAVVVESRGAECRILNPIDVVQMHQIMDADSGSMLHARDQQPSDPDLAWLSNTPSFIVFKSWD